MKIMTVVPLLFLCLCSCHRYSYRDLLEYDQAMVLAESRGIEVAGMKAHFFDMLESYALHPGEDGYVAAAKASSSAQGWLAASTMLEASKPVPVAPPLSFGQWQRAR